jgi:RND superfamily putative drug exporter
MSNDYTRTIWNMLSQADDLQTSIDAMTEMMNIQEDLAAVSASMADKMSDTSLDMNDVRDHLADFDDQFRRNRNYLYWNRTASTSRCAGRCARSSTRWTDRHAVG